MHSREIRERIVITGRLVLETPAHFGGDGGITMVDMPLHRDSLTGRAVLTGASLAGALRNYLREREQGYRADGKKGSLENTLLGFQKDDEGEQSWLIVSDVLAEENPFPAGDEANGKFTDETAHGNKSAGYQIELRDGVAVNAATRVAEDKKKYDWELLAAGAGFPLRLELLVKEGDREKLLHGLAITLQGLERGEIALGARKNRGFGRCRVNWWEVHHYNLGRPEGLWAWLSGGEGEKAGGPRISELLNVPDADLDRRGLFSLDAIFTLDGSLIIRSGSGGADDPDAVHLRSFRLKRHRPVPVLSGTSLAGALRARALRIARTIGPEENATDLVNGLFGPPGESRAPRAGRLAVEETEIVAPLEQVVNRVKIDRFTGGAFPAALFNEQPLYGLDETRVKVKLTVQNPEEEEIGLLLLLLKDLWTGDLPLGGGAGIGRGRLRGLEARVACINNGRLEKEWLLRETSVNQLIIEGGPPEELEKHVRAFVRRMEENGL
ncbi:hypothetical protein A6M21_02770 [Desulfotomaculum copahuensis]|uniref:CRISPR type III-associated protein domain-containing protein n=2 Tax=Desulfotomaculum copahuensis TaxID=1838280 RepID=A0A1B7LJK9_9FIRM|nr:hypothetical protein A6M21_02770 [Desulfotomaculum copahuensis]